jgi:hypothetical protein
MVEELRSKVSRDNRELLDRAADEIENLDEKLAAAHKRIEELEISNRVNLCEALQSIVWYNGHAVWLSEVCEELKKLKETGEKYINYPCPLEVAEWHTEKHAIWELLVGSFGDWGTSIRGGWIEDFDGCIEFIEYLIEEDEQ